MSRGTEPRPTFIRALSLTDAGALVVGCIIGAGIFRTAAPIARILPYPGAILLVWLLGGGLSLCGALCYAELAVLLPQTGGDYVYLSRAYGRLTGFLFGWTKLFIERTGTIAILAYVSAEYAQRALGFPPDGIKPAAMTAIGGLTALNIIGVRYGTAVQNIATTLKVASLAGIVFVGCWMRRGDPAHWQPLWPSSFDGSIVSAMGLALIYVLWTYGGWTEAAYVAEEVRQPERNLPRAIIGGVVMTMLLYLAVNAIYLAYVPVATMAQERLVASAMMQRAVGVWGGVIIAVMVSCSAFGALNGYILTGGRILYALGRDHALFAAMGRVHPRHHTPALALALNAAIAILLVWTKTFDQILTYSTVIISIFYGLAGWSVFRLRRLIPPPVAAAEGSPRQLAGQLVAGATGGGTVPERWKPEAIPGYPLTPLVFVASMAALVANGFIVAPRESMFGFGLLMAGLPLYAWSQRRTIAP